jgi:hypothetical protein
MGGKAMTNAAEFLNGVLALTNGLRACNLDPNVTVLLSEDDGRKLEFLLAQAVGPLLSNTQVGADREFVVMGVKFKY